MISNIGKTSIKYFFVFEDIKLNLYNTKYKNLFFGELSFPISLINDNILFINLFNIFGKYSFSSTFLLFLISVKSLILLLFDCFFLSISEFVLF